MSDDENEAMRIEAPYTVPQFVGVSPDLNH
jgi:hypothetical protein